jgi:hypothetical protein
MKRTLRLLVLLSMVWVVGCGGSRAKVEKPDKPAPPPTKPPTKAGIEPPPAPSVQ